MLRLFTIIISLVSAVPIFGQRQVEGPFKLEVDPYNNVAQILQNCQAKGFSLFLQDKHAAWAVKINDSLEIGSPVKLTNLGADNDLLEFAGGIHQADKVVLFYSNQKRTKLHATTVNYQNGFLETKQLAMPLDKHEKPWCYYTLDDKLYILAKNEKDSTLSIATIGDDLTVEKRKYSVAKTFLFTKSHHTNAYLFNSANKHQTATVIRPNLVYETQHTFSSVKLYPQSDRLLLTSDREREFTSCVDIDFTSGKVSGRDFPQPRVEEGLKTNSFVYDNRLFQVKASRKALKLTVSNMHTQEVLTSYQLNRRGPMTFGDPIVYQQNIPTNKISVLFRELFGGMINTTQLAIAVNQEKGQYHCQIGAFEAIDIVYYYSHPISTIPSTAGLTTTFGLPIPIGYMSSTIDTYVRASLSMNTLTYIPAPYLQTIQGKISRFQQIMRDRIAVETMAIFQGQCLYGFYDKQLKNYTLSAYSLE